MGHFTGVLSNFQMLEYFSPCAENRGEQAKTTDAEQSPAVQCSCQLLTGTDMWRSYKYITMEFSEFFLHFLGKYWMIKVRGSVERKLNYILLSFGETE